MNAHGEELKSRTLSRGKLISLPSLILGCPPRRQCLLLLHLQAPDLPPQPLSVGTEACHPSFLAPLRHMEFLSQESEQTRWQPQQCRILFNPLCWTGDQTYILVLHRCCPSRCTIVGNSLCSWVFFFFGFFFFLVTFLYL